MFWVDLIFKFACTVTDIISEFMKSQLVTQVKKQADSLYLAKKKKKQEIINDQTVAVFEREIDDLKCKWVCSSESCSNNEEWCYSQSTD